MTNVMVSVPGMPHIGDYESRAYVSSLLDTSFVVNFANYYNIYRLYQSARQANFFSARLLSTGFPGCLSFSEQSTGSWTPCFSVNRVLYS
jgi:hypothetical protein